MGSGTPAGNRSKSGTALGTAETRTTKGVNVNRSTVPKMERFKMERPRRIIFYCGYFNK
jgi:hypothetical protein